MIFLIYVEKMDGLVVCFAADSVWNASNTSSCDTRVNTIDC